MEPANGSVHQLAVENARTSLVLVSLSHALTRSTPSHPSLVRGCPLAAVTPMDKPSDSGHERLF